MITLEELIDTVQMLDASSNTKRVVNADTQVGLYIELKDYDTYLSEKGWDLAQMLFDTLEKHGLSTVADCKDKLPIIVQSFDPEGLKKFATLSDLPLVQLIHATGTKYDYDDIATYAHGVGPDSKLMMDNDYVENMHASNIAVHPWTIKDDDL